MTKDYAFRIVNVFAESPLGGNPLCVFEDARGLADATMQALALQFNLSETTFVLPSTRATARVRIFTPTFEMPFAGHPTLGSAHVVRDLHHAGDSVTLEMHAGIIPVEAAGDVWTLEARPPKHRRVDASHAELARTLGVDEADIGERPLWIDTGSEQLIVPLNSFEAVQRATPDASLMSRFASNDARSMAYVFARDDDAVRARFFFQKHGAIIEDPGTGSACANLGGWLLVTDAPRPQRLSVDQGSAVGRPCRLTLELMSDARIRVSGRVVQLAYGTLTV
ncbi:MAG TPA: PhzF family phenazine biosynthesis protein [Casimicrobiaceae bacterium]|nr:PhzF family phenazine biosynthesis protein [Casimicrobiaceae bacterium]